MKRLIAVTMATMIVLGVSSAWALTKVTVTREDNKPQTVEVKVGEEVRWVNATGGKEGRIRFEKPETYEYAVHVTGVKSHAHRGSVIVT